MHVFYMDRLRHNNAEQTRASREMVQAIWLAAGWGSPPCRRPDDLSGVALAQLALDEFACRRAG